MNAPTVTQPGRVSDRFADLLAALSRPDAFPFRVADGEPHLLQTHASAILLAQNRAYKIKKPKDFGFFDFSTPALRRKYCMRETTLNARLAPSVYLGVAPVLATRDSCVRFGRTLPAHLAPQPGVPLDSGTVIDYAVVMVRLPEEATLQSRIASGTASAHLLRQVARHVAAFHAHAPTDEHIAHFGAPEVIRANWDENFAQLRPFVGRVLDQQRLDEIETYVHTVLRNRAALFVSRVREGRIRDCHGDLRLQHVYALGEEPDPARHLAIVDCIEFNERFRYGDVAAEVAFLAMELEAAGRLDLAHDFVDTYLEETGDEALRELLPFYLCYRACVRAKVLAFLLSQPEVPAPQREAAEEQARRLLTLARHYARGRTRPALVMVGGTMGTGKSTLAARLHQALGWPLFSSDVLRKQLTHLDQREPVAAAFGQGPYAPEWTERTYAALLAAAQATLAAGRSVLLDATYGQRGFRQAAQAIAQESGAQAALVECTCATAIARERLARRWQARTHRPRAVTSADVAFAASDASDGRPELFDTQRAAWQPYDPQTEIETAHLVVATERPQAAIVGQVLDELGLAMGCDLALEAQPPAGTADVHAAASRKSVPA